MQIISKESICAYDNGEIEHCIILYILSGICIKPYNHSKQFIIKLAKTLFTSNKQIIQNNDFHSLSLERQNKNNYMNLVCA